MLRNSSLLSNSSYHCEYKQDSLWLQTDNAAVQQHEITSSIKTLAFQERFGILLDIRLSGVAEQL